MKRLRTILLTAMMCWAVAVAPADDGDPPEELRAGPGIIIDNADSFTAVATGKWITVESNPNERYGESFVFINGGQAGTGISFKPLLSTEGQYVVFIRYLTMSGSSRKVSVIVRHADGESAHTLDQSKHAGKWHELGCFNFKPGADAEVHVDAASADGLVTADAVMFSRMVTMAELQAIQARERAEEEARKEAALEAKRAEFRASSKAAAEEGNAKSPEEVVQEYYQDPKTLEAIRAAAQERLEKTKELTGAVLTLYETDHFLIYTDIEPKTARQVAVFAERLEKVLRNPFDVPEDQFLWPGKLVVWVFKNKKDYDIVGVEIDEFVREEANATQFRGFVIPNVDVDSNGNPRLRVHVTISYENEYDIGKSLERTSFFDTFAHETTHAFAEGWPMYGRIPTWFNEGLAEFAAGEAVSKAHAASQRQKAYRQVREAPGAVLSMMADDRNYLSFGHKGTIDEYGIAQSLVRYLYLAKKEGLFTCYHALKQGRSTDEAMQEAFGIDTRKFIELWCKKAKSLPGGP